MWIFFLILGSGLLLHFLIKHPMDETKNLSDCFGMGSIMVPISSAIRRVRVSLLLLILTWVLGQVYPEFLHAIEHFLHLVSSLFYFYMHCVVFCLLFVPGMIKSMLCDGFGMPEANYNSKVKRFFAVVCLVTLFVAIWLLICQKLGWMTKQM